MVEWNKLVLGCLKLANAPKWCYIKQQIMHLSLYVFCTVVFLLMGENSVLAQDPVYQFGLNISADPQPAAPAPHDETTLTGETHAFLWIPPHAPKIQAVVVCPANIIERRICSDEIMRQEAAQDGVALLFFQPSWGRKFLDSPNLVPFVESMLNQFADVSGYDELRTVPWIPVGHSGNSQFCAALARAKPERTLANIVIKGALPGPDQEAGATAGLVGIPILFVTGQFEEVPPPGGVIDFWWGQQMRRFAATKAAVPEALINGIEDRSHGHLNWFPDMARYVALFMHKAIATRLPSTNEGLKAVTFDQGWLADPDEKNSPAAVQDYKGDRAAAFWFFDEDQVKAWQPLYDKDRGKQTQMLAFVQDGAVAPLWAGWMVQELKFEPLPDGESFTVEAKFRDEVPVPLSNAGTKLGHAQGGDITYQVLGWAGNMQQTGPNTFRVHFDREGVNGRTVHVLIGAIHPGDDTYRETVGVATLDVPYHNTGTPQKITFQPVADVSTTTTSVALNATVDSGRQPDYFVSWGPAQVDGNQLKIVDVPDRAKFPLEIKVTAYQWGSATAPGVASANPVTQTFHLTK